ncbi:MAG: DUF2125 domain-containing protein [Pseudomonadota bacterium]|nr:DUF2125 domain-containing protein [Pseudomonadota bacterium]
MTKRRLLVTALIVLVALHAGLWFWATARLRDGYAEWADARRAEGWTITNEPPRRAGWPLAAALIVPHPVIDGGEIAWRAGQMQLRLTPWHPRVLDIIPQGTEHVRLGALPVLAIAGPVVAHIRLDGSLPPEIDGTGIRLAASGAMVTCTSLHATARGTSLHAEARGIVLSQDRSWPLGSTIASFEMAATSTGPIAPASSASTARQQVARWRDAGGRVVISAASLHWGPLAAHGTGSASLDAQLQPAADATLQLDGWQKALGVLEQGGTVSSGTALAVHAVLGLFARATPGGGVALPVSLANGLVRAGGVPVARIRPIAWP